MERERGISVTTSVMQFEYSRSNRQSARHARPRGLLGRHLSYADGGRFGADDHRRREGRRTAHDQVDGSVPAARHADSHVHQQARPRDPRADRRCSTKSKRYSASSARRSRGRSVPDGIFAVSTTSNSIASTATRRVMAIICTRSTRSRGWTRPRRATTSAPTTRRSSSRSIWCAARATRSIATRICAAKRRRCFSAPRSATSAWRTCSTASSRTRRQPQPRAAHERIVSARRGDLQRFRIQDPGEHGSEAPRPHRVSAHLFRSLSSGHAHAPRPDRQRHQDHRRGDVHGR